MPEIALLLWDVGGVLLSNGWDHSARAAAAARFGLDPAELERRHGLVDGPFETGRLDTEGYLSATVFYEPRSFLREEFVAFMHARSTPNPGAIATARALRASGRYRMATLNNESRELNEYRLRSFGLRDLFDVFFSSCYTGRRKPDPDAYRFALELTQRAPDECLFLDDRPENLEAATGLGLRTLRVLDPARLAEDLARAGVASG
ncbi:MAG: HAD family hydrolase [Thermoplasmata archaeon]